MTSIYGDYSNIRDTREQYLDSAQAGDDTLLLSMIQQASVDIDLITHRRFYPVVETRVFDTPYKTNDLFLNDSLLDVTEVLNGDGSAVPVASLKLVPYNTRTHHSIRLLPNISTWKNSGSGYSDAAITVTGVWAHCADYTSGWMDLDILAANMLIGATSFEATPSVFYSGMLLKIDDEFIYVSSVDAPVVTIPPTVPPDATDTVHIIRGVNGTVAAAHSAAAVVYRWNPGRDIAMLTAAAATAYYHLKSNPSGNSYTLDGVSFETPKDVTEFIRTRLVQLNLIKVGIG